MGLFGLTHRTAPVGGTGLVVPVDTLVATAPGIYPDIPTLVPDVGSGVGMIRDFRLLLRQLPKDGQLSFPLDTIDAITRVVARDLSGSIWESAAYPPFHLVFFSTYLDGQAVHEALDGALNDHPFAWVLSYENRQELHGWSAIESLEWFRLSKTGTEGD
jgi:hypothetical protein